MNDENAVNYWQIIEPFWYDEELNNSEPDVYLKRFAELTEPQKVIYPVHWLYSEVNNGGFHQFFSNFTGVLAPEAVSGFRSIGLNDFAELVEEAMAFFENPYPRERERRENLLDSFAEKNEDVWNPFKKIDEKFYDRLEIEGVPFSENDRFGVAVDDYARKSLK